MCLRTFARVGCDVSEWQPARIGKPLSEIHVTYRGNFRKRPVDVVGKVVRVRTTDNREGYICDGQVVVVHPEDAKNILEIVNENHTARMCEHQILTD